MYVPGEGSLSAYYVPCLGLSFLYTKSVNLHRKVQKAGWGQHSRDYGEARRLKGEAAESTAVAQ